MFILYSNYYCLGCATLGYRLVYMEKQDRIEGLAVMNDYIDRLPWYKKDRLGWPIETCKGSTIKSFIRIVCQNIRKITG